MIERVVHLLYTMKRIRFEDAEEKMKKINDSLNAFKLEYVVEYYSRL